MVKVSPSILSADFSVLGDEIRRLDRYADLFHFDVMDGHFVPNITVGPGVLKSIRKCTSKQIEAHLMIENPSQYVDEFAKAGADTITVHIEADKHARKTLERIKKLGKKAGISLNPATPVSAIERFLENADLILVMTVDPGFGGQQFMDSALKKVERLRTLIDQKGIKAEIEVDGGINADTGRKCIKAGADILVAGSYIYNSKDAVAAITSLKELNRNL